MPRHKVGVALALAMLAPAVVWAEARVAVVPLGEGDDLRVAIRVARAIRVALKEKGQSPLDPARQLRQVTTASSALRARAEARFKAGLALYDSLEFKKAEVEFRESAKASRSAMELGAPPGGYVRTLLYLAASCLFESRKSDALARFSDAIAFAPDGRPDAKIFSPEVIAAYEEARQRPKGTLRVTMRGAEVGEVIVDRRWAGITPLDLQGLTSGEHFIEVRRAGRASAMVWRAVPAGGETAVEAELEVPETLAAYRSAEAAAARELAEGKPGAGTASLLQLVQAGAIVLVARQGGTTTAAWAEGGVWTRRYRATVEEGREPVFASGLLTAGVVEAGCQSSSDCSAGQACSSGRCVQEGESRPIYKRWWFWTAIGAVAAGATVGLAVGLSSRKQEWTAEVAARGGL